RMLLFNLPQKLKSSFLSRTLLNLNLNLNLNSIMSVSSPNHNSLAGILIPKDACVVIVRTQWNADAVDKLEAGCRKILLEHEVNFGVITVPGAFELPFAI